MKKVADEEEKQDDRDEVAPNEPMFNIQDALKNKVVSVMQEKIKDRLQQKIKD